MAMAQETEFDDVSLPSSVGRVRAVIDEGRRVYVDLRNGQSVTVDRTEPLEFKVGQVVIVCYENNTIAVAPSELWPDESWVGIVRLKRDGFTVVDTNGRWKLINTFASAAAAYQEGNTVEGSDTGGILRVLSHDPIRYIDLPTVDDDAIAKFRRTGSGSETFADFGGLEHVVRRATELVELPLRYRKPLSDIGARPIKGVLFTGPPGTGKTMLARIIANCVEAAFYEVSGPEILSRWYGQSEELLRRLFDDAAKQQRAIVFFDEIDSLAGQRQHESHEASRRVVAQLLTLMDGFKADSNVVVIAATNRPQDIDAALRRPGRFDWELEFPMPNDDDRRKILEVTSKRLATHGALPLAWMATKTTGWSAAELAAIWSEAALLAVADNRTAIMCEDCIGGLERVAGQRNRATRTESKTT